MTTNPFENLNFDQNRKLRLSPRTIFMIATTALYTIAYWALSSVTFFWLGLLVILALAWAASFGWREAISGISKFFQRLERF